MLAINNFANKATAGSQTEETLKVCAEFIKNASKRKREEEPEEEENVTVVETVNLVDDSATQVNMKIRQSLRNINAPPNEWWKPEVMNKVTKPIIGQNLYLESLMPGRVNPRAVRRAHDRSMLLTTKALASKNAGNIGERKFQYKLTPTEDSDETVLTGSRSFADVKTCHEVVESVMNLGAIVFQIRPYSYEVWALLRCMHHIYYYYSITDDAKTQKMLLEKLVSETWSYNQRRGAENKFPATFKRCLEIAKEVAITSGFSADILCLKSDPYCGKRSAASTSSTQKVQDLEKEVKELRQWKQTMANKPASQGYNNTRQIRGRGGSFRKPYGFTGLQHSNAQQQPMGSNFQNFRSLQNFSTPQIQYPTSQFQGQGAPQQNSQSQQDAAKMTREKLAETCVLYNGGGSCDNSCGLRHLCSNIVRPGRLCWLPHPQVDHQ